MLKRLTSRNHKLNEENYEHYTIQIKEEDGEEENYDNRLGIDNSYSYIEKANFKRARYKVINDVEDMKNVINVLNDWKLSKPKLIVSVTGGAGQFILPSRIKTAFKYGIAKIAESTDALIITGGTQTGVMKLVGEGMAKYYQKDDIKLLGVASWECTKFRNELLEAQNSQTKNGYVYDFNLEKSEVPKGMALLDRNHSHFILVRNLKNVEALQKTGIAPFGGEIEFRNKLEESLRKNSNISIPTILIVLNGGKNTIKTVELSIKNKVPVLLIAESEGCADLIAKILIHYTKSISKFNINDFEKDMLDIQIKPDELERMKKSLLAICDGAKNKLINVFNFDKGEDLEISIIKTFLNSRSEKEKLHDNLNLALKWNKIDIATNDIFNGKEEFTSKQLNQSLEMALVYNRPQFVELLLENKLVLDDFFTSKRLYYLYNAIVDKDPKQAPFLNYLRRYKKNGTLISFEQVKSFLKGILEVPVIFLPKDYYDSNDSKVKLDRRRYLEKYINETRKQQRSDIESTDQTSYADIQFEGEKPNAALNLFTWAILFNRIEIAKIFLQQGDSQIIFSLMASQVLRHFGENFNDESTSKSAAYFENLAISILDLFDKNESDYFNDNLLLTKNPHFGVHLLSFSNNAECEKFMATSCAQKVLNEIWNNGILFSHGKKIYFRNSFANVALSYLTFGLVSPFFQQFDIEIKKSVSHDEENQPNRDLTAHRLVYTRTKEYPKGISDYRLKYMNFMYSPKSHFLYRTVFYFIFLSLFSYLMLSKFHYYSSNDDAEKCRQLQSSPVSGNLNISELLNNSTALGESSPDPPDCEPSSPHWIEYTLIFWVFCFLCQEISQLVPDNEETFKKNFSEYISDGWNQFDLIGICFFSLGMLLRFLSISFGENLFGAARIILCLGLSIYFLRLLQISKRFRNLGPTLLMIQRMLSDLMFFIIIISIFVLSYGITTHSILFPGSSFDFGLLRSLFNLAYWPIYGEITFNGLIENAEDGKALPTEGVVYGYISTMVYMCIANVLLLNLLIAMFSSTYGDLENQTDQIWKFENYAIIYEFDKYYNRFPLPPPLNLITYVIAFFDSIRKRLTEEEKPLELTDQGDKTVIEKEQKYSVIILKNENIRESEKEHTILKQSAEKLRLLEKKSNEISKVSEKIKGIELKLNETQDVKKELSELQSKLDDLAQKNQRLNELLERFLVSQSSE